MSGKKRPTYETCNDIFPSRLRKRLSEMGINQSDLARAVGVTPQAISKYLTGQVVPELATVVKIARHLRVSIDYLCGLSDSYSLDMSIREICDRANLTDSTLSVLSRLSCIDYDFLGMGSGRDIDAKQVIYVLNRMILHLCNEERPLLRDITCYCMAMYEIGCAVGINTDCEYPGKGGSLALPPDADYYKWQRWNISHGIERLLDTMSDRDIIQAAANDFLTSHPDIFWTNASGKAGGPVVYDPNTDTPQEMSFKDHDALLKGRLSDTVNNAMERLNGIRKEENE